MKDIPVKNERCIPVKNERYTGKKMKDVYQ